MNNHGSNDSIGKEKSANVAKMKQENGGYELSDSTSKMNNNNEASTKTTKKTMMTTPTTSRFVKHTLLTVVGIALIMYGSLWNYHLVPHMDEADDISFHPPPKQQLSLKQQLFNETNQISIVNSTSIQSTTNNIYSMPKLSELTQNPPNGSVHCPSPYMVPIYDKVVVVNEQDKGSKIPRIIHVSFNQRCVPDELAKNIVRWQEALPNYSFYFHDDDAVQRLLSLSSQQESQMSVDFPNLAEILNCVKYKGAMKIDIWRILITYYYGGLYTDIDVTPQSNFSNETIHPNDTFFTLTDGKDRPSQWLFGMSPGHYIGILTMDEIQRRLLRMRNIAKPRVVSITGPQALKAGYNRFMVLKNRNELPNNIPPEIQVTKIPAELTLSYASGSKHMDDIVEFEGHNITVREKIENISGVIHWPDQVNSNRSGIPYEGVSCFDYLAMLKNTTSSNNA
jgi:mannosyltransferase OCH1-like enzyme